VDPRVRGNRPADTLRSELEAAAAVVFADALPDGVELGIEDSTSYAQWLRRRASVPSRQREGKPTGT
jgi:hypothetical protein